MRKTRILAVVAALPLVAFDCGGKSPSPQPSPFGLNCKIHIAGPGVSEDMWCIVAAWDYSVDPGGVPSWTPLATWGFELTAYRPNLMDVGAGVGVFLAGPPTLGAAYGWDGASATSGLDGGSATRWAGSMTNNTVEPTHDASSIAETGSLQVRFSQIPPPGAQQQAILVHGSLFGTIEPMGAGTTLSISATF
jgi:hypothetical protein